MLNDLPINDIKDYIDSRRAYSSYLGINVFKLCDVSKEGLDKMKIPKELNGKKILRAIKVHIGGISFLDLIVEADITSNTSSQNKICNVGVNKK